MADDDATAAELFGDDNDDDEADFEADGDEFVEVVPDNPLAADTARLRQPVWLVRVPAATWEQLSADGSIGHVVMSRCAANARVAARVCVLTRAPRSPRAPHAASLSGAGGHGRSAQGTMVPKSIALKTAASEPLVQLELVHDGDGRSYIFSETTDGTSERPASTRSTASRGTRR